MSVLQNFLDEVESWIGTPFFTEGCTKGVKGGTNCGHWFVVAVAKTVPNSEAILEGLNWSHIAFLKSTEDIMPQIVSKVAIEVSLNEIQPGDIVFTRIRRRASTPAVYIGDGLFVYCHWTMKQVVKMPLFESYRSRIMHVFRLNALLEEV